eukprot:TRINITY_DN75887_c0_g1_i1.p1 TRINITY_DN75887_c0_g1~~TRINITY_DN75887_c0_g1_i1.p1  ORF type:complete len:391 (-),score=28.96 TRINITY_DN75887_c0_g1_i1:67-1212(-)
MEVTTSSTPPPCSESSTPISPTPNFTPTSTSSSSSSCSPTEPSGLGRKRRIDDVYTKDEIEEFPLTPPPKEKRQARWKSQATPNDTLRIQRAQQQRLFLIEWQPIGPYHRRYQTLGSTGNVYQVDIKNLITCSCPDFCKGNLCKHILFVKLKVLKIAANHPWLLQSGLLNNELQQIFSQAPDRLNDTQKQPHDHPNDDNAEVKEGEEGGGEVEQEGILAHKSVRLQFQRIQGKITEEEQVTLVSKEEGRNLDEECAICCDPLRSVMEHQQEPLLICPTCNNCVHKTCFKAWYSLKIEATGVAECMFCRAEWPQDMIESANKKPQVQYNEGYLTLGHLQPGTQQARSYGAAPQPALHQHQPSTAPAIPQNQQTLPWQRQPVK